MPMEKRKEASNQLPSARPLTDRERRAISLLRVFSILSVIAAHVNVIASEGDMLRGVVTRFWDAFGQVGVIGFLIIGGFLYHREPGDGSRFWKKKLTTVVLPWAVCSLLTYAVSVILTGQVSLLGYVKWIFGYGTWYYYFTIYMIFILLFGWLSKKEILLYICMALTVVAIAFNTFAPLLSETLCPAPYLNPLHWVGFFALGILARKYRWDRVLTDHPITFAVSFALAVGTLICLYLFQGFGYFHLLSVPWELFAAVTLWGLSFALAGCRHVGFWAAAGDDTYCVYLLHMQIVQFVTARLPSNLLFDLANPIIATLGMILLVAVCKKLVRLLPFGDFLCRLVGLRMPAPKGTTPQ